MDVLEHYLRRARLVDDPRDMRVVASGDVRDAIVEHGGRLYLWVSRHGCCFGGVKLLEARAERPPDETRQFRRVPADGFELYLDAAMRVWPEEVVLEVHGRGRRVSAYWNDQAWVG